MTQTSQSEVITSGKYTFPASRKGYRQGSRPDIRVPFREVDLAPTAGRFGDEDNPPLPLYDTSGPYTDPEVETALHKGLPPLRQNWILARDRRRAGVSGATG